MLKKLKELFTPHELLKGNYGIEREGLRVNDKGQLSLKDHPSVFGDKVDNIIQVVAPILPIIIIIRQPYLLARPDTIGPVYRKV